MAVVDPDKRDARSLDVVLARRIRRTDQPMFVARTPSWAACRPRIVATNAAFRQLTGFDESYLLGRPLRTLYSMWTGGDNRRYLLRAVANGAPVRARMLGMRRNQTSFPAEWSLVPMSTEGGAMFWTCAVRDESDRWLRRNLTAAAANASDLPTALEALQEAIREDVGWAYSEAWVATRDRSAVKPSTAGPHDAAPLRRFREISHHRGFRPGEGVPGRVFEHGRWDWIGDIAKAPASLFTRRDAALKAGLRSLLAVPVHGEDGVAAILVFYGSRPRRLDRSLVDRIAGAVTHLGPVLERKRIEVALRHRAKQQRAVATLGVNALDRRPDLDSLLQQAARTVADTLDVEFCKILDLEPDGGGRLRLRAGVGWKDGLVGRTVLGSGQESHGGFTLQAREPVIVDDLLRETRFRPPDLLVQHGVRSGVSVLVHGPRRPWGVLGAHTTVRRRFEADDVHFLQGIANVLGAAIQRHRAEQQLDQHRRSLEQMVRERTRKLEASHESLRQAERLAAIGTLAAGLGHDMSNLLLPTLCRLDTLDAADLPEDVRAELRGARKTLDYLSELSQGLRLLALDPDHSSPPQAATDIASWWKEARPVLANVLPRGSELRAKFSPGLPPVAMPKHHLTQAVLNLLLNAADAMDTHGRVSVAVTRDGGRIRLTVTDNGRGMAPDVRRQALDPFFSTKTRSLSTGLGLSLVRALAKRNGGSVSVESVPGQGTRVTLLLHEAESGSRAGGRRGGRALLRLGDARMLALTARFMEANGYRVCSNGEDEAYDICVLAAGEVPASEALRHAARGRRVVWLGDWNGKSRPEGLVALDPTTSVSTVQRILRRILHDDAGESPRA